MRVLVVDDDEETRRLLSIAIGALRVELESEPSRARTAEISRSAQSAAKKPRWCYACRS